MLAKTSPSPRGAYAASPLPTPSAHGCGARFRRRTLCGWRVSPDPPNAKSLLAGEREPPRAGGSHPPRAASGGHTGMPVPSPWPPSCPSSPSSLPGPQPCAGSIGSPAASRGAEDAGHFGGVLGQTSPKQSESRGSLLPPGSSPPANHGGVTNTTWRQRVNDGAD